MCGIVGFIENKYNINKADIDLFETMLLVDSLRGLDSTGAFCVYGKSGSVNWIKQATNPLNLFKRKEWDNFTSKAIQSGGILVGHNRKATQGAINTDNAHPFIEGDIILIHNGGISNFKKFDPTKTVDSHAVCAAINKEGHEAILPELEGAWVLVWYNLKTKRLYFHRNSQRPLHWAQTEHHQIFASELEFAQFGAARGGLPIKKKWEFATNTLSEYDVVSGGWYSKEIKPKTTIISYGSKWNGYGSVYDTDYTTVVTPTKVSPPWEKENPEVVLKPSNIMLGFEGDDDLDISADQVIAMQITGMRKDTATNKVKIMGKCISPHLPECDVIGFVDYTDLDKAMAMYPENGVYKATVSSITRAVCGLSLWVKGIEDTEYIYDYKGTKWSANTIRYLVLENNGCNSCKNKDIGIESIPYSIITRNTIMRGNSNTPYNLYTIMCPDCVAKTLQGDEKNAFETRYLNALQDGKQVNSQIAEQTH